MRLIFEGEMQTCSEGSQRVEERRLSREKNLSDRKMVLQNHRNAGAAGDQESNLRLQVGPSCSIGSAVGLASCALSLQGWRPSASLNNAFPLGGKCFPSI